MGRWREKRREAGVSFRNRNGGYWGGPLLRSECEHRLDGRGATGGQIAGKIGDGNYADSDGGVGDRIYRTYVEEY